MIVKLLADLGGHKTGDEINVTTKSAEQLTSNGNAEHVTAKPTPKKRGRKPATTTPWGGTPAAAAENRPG